MEVTLKFNHEYSNYSGNYNTQVKIVSCNPTPIAEGVMGFTVRLEEDVTLEFVDETSTRKAVLPAGDYLASARGNQYNPAKHVEGQMTSIGFSWKEGEAAPLINLLPSTMVRGMKPVITFIEQAVDTFEVAQ